MTKREYLITLGLAKPGRGRFSREGIAAIKQAEADGIVFDDNTISIVTVEIPDAPYTPPPVKPWGVYRDASVMRGTTDEGWIIEWGMCDRCARALRYCPCPDGPAWPHGVTALVEAGTMKANEGSPHG